MADRTDAEWLTAVKSWLTIGGAYNDAQLTLRIDAIKELLISGGISAARLETAPGILLVAQGVNDAWNLSSGEMKFSPGFEQVKRTYQALTLADVEAAADV